MVFSQNTKKYYFNASQTQEKRLRNLADTVLNTKMSKGYCSGKYLGARTGMVLRFLYI